MEFIPLEGDDKKGKKPNKSVKTQKSSPIGGKSKKNDEGKNAGGQQTGKLRKMAGKNVKNQFKEKILEKRMQKSVIKKNKKKLTKLKKEAEKKVTKSSDENEEEMDLDDVVEDETDEKFEDDSEDGEEEEEEVEEEEEEENTDEEEAEEERREKAKREKWKRMDDKKKNRLFVKMKKKIHSESQIKELHPDIKGVIFPRKKNSKWCWAVFVSEESALKAFAKLAKNKDIFVGKPNTRDQVELKREKKLVTLKRKKQATKKLLNMWT